MNILLAVLLGFIIYLGVFAIIDRICRCAEHCANAKSYGASISNGLVKEKENNS